MRKSKKNRVRPEPVDWQSRFVEIDPDEFQRIKDSATFVDFTKRSDGRRVSPWIHNQDELLFYLKYREFRDLSHPPNAKVIATAAQKNDLEFFIKLGKALSSAPRETYFAFDKLEKFLWQYWIKGRTENEPPLCLFTVAALCDYLFHVGVVGENDKSVHKARKAIERLGLVKAKAVVIRRVKPTSKGILFF